MDYGRFMDMAENGEIGLVELQDNQIVFTSKDGSQIYKTGRMEDPDPALTRPGRFDRRVPVELPDLKGREEIYDANPFPGGRRAGPQGQGGDT